MSTSPAISRYHRQTILPGVGPEGEAKLAGGHVMVFGAGALGCPALDLLVRAGVGRVSVVDRDVVELTNLQRQTLYCEQDVGQSKAEAAVNRLRRVNSGARLEAIAEDVTRENVEALVRGYPQPSVILDCTDNFATRYLLNDVAVKYGLVLVYGGAISTRGMQMTMAGRAAGAGQEGDGPCLRCIWPEMPSHLMSGAMETCDTAGIFAPVSTIIGATMASEAIKVLIDVRLASQSLLWFDLWKQERTRMNLSGARDTGCICCGDEGAGGQRFEFLAGKGAAREPMVLCGQNAVQVWPERLGLGDGFGGDGLATLMARLERAGTFVRTPLTVSGTLHDGTKLTVFADGRAIVSGTVDAGRARSVVARYVGG